MAIPFPNQSASAFTGWHSNLPSTTLPGNRAQVGHFVCSIASTHVEFLSASGMAGHHASLTILYYTSRVHLKASDVQDCCSLHWTGTMQVPVFISCGYSHTNASETFPPYTVLQPRPALTSHCADIGYSRCVPTPCRVPDHPATRRWRYRPRHELPPTEHHAHGII